jgi:hypothetical protein
VDQDRNRKFRWKTEGQRSGASLAMSPYLTIAEAAELARVSPKRLRNLMADGTLHEGVHYTRPRGLRPRFNSDAIVAWIEGRDTPALRPKSSALPQRSRCKVDLGLVPPVETKANGV